jgi:hypothetical protein
MHPSKTLLRPFVALGGFTLLQSLVLDGEAASLQATPTQVALGGFSRARPTS